MSNFRSYSTLDAITVINRKINDEDIRVGFYSFLRFSVLFSVSIFLFRWFDWSYEKMFQHPYPQPQLRVGLAITDSFGSFWPI